MRWHKAPPCASERSSDVGTYTRRPLPHGRGSDHDAPAFNQSRDREGAISNIQTVSP